MASVLFGGYNASVTFGRLGFITQNRLPKVFPLVQTDADHQIAFYQANNRSNTFGIDVMNFMTQLASAPEVTPGLSVVASEPGKLPKKLGNLPADVLTALQELAPSLKNRVVLSRATVDSGANPMVVLHGQPTVSPSFNTKEVYYLVSSRQPEAKTVNVSSVAELINIIRRDHAELD